MMQAQILALSAHQAHTVRYEQRLRFSATQVSTVSRGKGNVKVAKLVIIVKQDRMHQLNVSRVLTALQSQVSALSVPQVVIVFKELHSRPYVTKDPIVRVEHQHAQSVPLEITVLSVHQSS